MLFGYLRFDRTPERWPKHCATDAASTRPRSLRPQSNSENWWPAPTPTTRYFRSWSS